MLLQELLSGDVPFASIRNEIALLLAVTSGKRPNRDIPPFHSDRLWNVITQCWAQEPNNRLSTAVALKSVREATASVQQISSTNPQSSGLSTAVASKSTR